MRAIVIVLMSLCTFNVSFAVDNPFEKTPLNECLLNDPNWQTCNERFGAKSEDRTQYRPNTKILAYKRYNKPLLTPPQGPNFDSPTAAVANVIWEGTAKAVYDQGTPRTQREFSLDFQYIKTLRNKAGVPVNLAKIPLQKLFTDTGSFTDQALKQTLATGHYELLVPVVPDQKFTKLTIPPDMKDHIEQIYIREVGAKNYVKLNDFLHNHYWKSKGEAGKYFVNPNNEFRHN